MNSASVHPRATGGMTPGSAVSRPFVTIVLRAAGSVSVGLPTIFGPYPPWPLKPWHFAQTPV